MTTTVKLLVSDPAGRPVSGARVVATLSRPDLQAPDHEYVLPAPVTARSDAAGLVTLALWPNALGATASTYQISITPPGGATQEFTCTVPVSSQPVWLDQIASLPHYPGKTEGELALDAVQAAVVAAEAAAALSVSAMPSPMPANIALSRSYLADGRLATETGTIAGIAWTRAYTYESGRLPPVAVSVTDGESIWIRTYTYAADNLIDSTAWELQ